jgi:hypothetical protein
MQIKKPKKMNIFRRASLKDYKAAFKTSHAKIQHKASKGVFDLKI